MDNNTGIREAQRRAKLRFMWFRCLLVIKCTLRALLTCLPNSSITLWMCRKSAMCIFSHQKFPFHLKVKVCYGNYTIVIIGDQKSMINLIQFEATIWARHNTLWKWRKILKILTLVWMVQMWKSGRKILTMSLSHINATNAAIHLPKKVIWILILNSTMEKRQINATNVTMPRLRQVNWKNIWKCTVD